MVAAHLRDAMVQKARAYLEKYPSFDMLPIVGDAPGLRSINIKDPKDAGLYHQAMYEMALEYVQRGIELMGRRGNAIVGKPKKAEDAGETEANPGLTPKIRPKE